MEDSERISLIRRGNELLNQKDYKNSLKIFLVTDYKDGIIRIADYLYFDKNDKVAAIKLYKKANHQKVIDDFAEKAAQIVRLYLAEDKELEKQKKIAESVLIKEWKPMTIKSEDILQTQKKGVPDDTARGKNSSASRTDENKGRNSEK